MENWVKGMKRRGMLVPSQGANSAVITAVVEPQRLTQIQEDQLRTLPFTPQSAWRANDLMYKFPDKQQGKATQEVVRGFMEREGMSFQEAVDHVNTLLKQRAERADEARRVAPKIKQLTDIIYELRPPNNDGPKTQGGLTISRYPVRAVIEEISPLVELVQRTANNKLRIPNLDIAQEIRRELATNDMIPMNLRIIPDYQIRRLIDYTTKRHERELLGTRRPIAFTAQSNNGETDRTPYEAFNRSILENNVPNAELVPFYEFLVDYVRGS